MSEDERKLNTDIGLSGDIETAGHFSLYPLGINHYMDVIYQEIERARQKGTLTQGIHYSSRLDGTLSELFETLEEAFLNALETEQSHLVMTAVISANSPSPKKIP